MIDFCLNFRFLGKLVLSAIEILTGISQNRYFIDAVFFRWVQTSVRFSGSGSQKVLGKIGLILNLRDIKICSSFFFENY